MNKRCRALIGGLWFLALGLECGCVHMSMDNAGQVQSYPVAAVEAGWIRNGEPIEFDTHKWYPVNDYEILQDSEVYQVGEHKGVQVFVEKIAIKPYGRIYTKFDKNKFRYFERRGHD
jgi:hypothetical protein